MNLIIKALINTVHYINLAYFFTNNEKLSEQVEMALALGLGYKGNTLFIRKWKEDYYWSEVEKAEWWEAMPMGEFW